jgi:hypothetical protein
MAWPQTQQGKVRSIAAALAGDHAAAERMGLVLVDAGVCGGAGLFDEPESGSGGGCCATPVVPSLPAPPATTR